MSFGTQSGLTGPLDKKTDQRPWRKWEINFPNLPSAENAEASLLKAPGVREVKRIHDPAGGWRVSWQEREDIQ